jgi:basic membrane protein A
MSSVQQGYDVNTIETGEDASTYDQLIQNALEDGCDYMVVSSTYQDNVEAIADQYPDTKFILFDINSDSEVAADNMLYIYFKQNESSYLGGIVAAGLSKTGAIGAVGGVENPVIKDFITGYIDGAQAQNPDIKVSTAWVGDWSNSAKMKELCETQNSAKGVDVFFPIAGGAGTGAFEAANEVGDIWTLGVDSDQYKAFEKDNPDYANVIATSVTKEVGTMLVNVFKNIDDAKWGTLEAMGVKEGAVGIADNDYYEKVVPQDVKDAVKKAEAGIADGSITPKSYFDFASDDEYQSLIDSVNP